MYIASGPCVQTICCRRYPLHHQFMSTWSVGLSVHLSFVCYPIASQLQYLLLFIVFPAQARDQACLTGLLLANMSSEAGESQESVTSVREVSPLELHFAQHPIHEAVATKLSCPYEHILRMYTGSLPTDGIKVC